MCHCLTEAIGRGGALAMGEQIASQRRIARADRTDRGDRRMRGQPRAVGRYQHSSLGSESCQHSTHTGTYDGCGGRCGGLRIRFKFLCG